MPSLPEPPDEQSGIADWLLAVEAAVAVGVAASMRRAIMRPVEDYIDSLSLGIADPAILDAVPSRIAAVIRDELLPSVDEVYRIAAANAWNWAPTTRALDRGAADNFARLVNDFAEQWQSQASNRLVGSTFDIWLKVNSSIVENIQSGAGREALKEEIERLAGFSEFRADTIARTELASAYSNGNYEANIALGEYGPVFKEWLAGGPPRDREWHTALDGVVLPYGEDYDVDGEPMRGPHAPGASAGNVVNCVLEGETVLPIGDLVSITRAWWQGPTIQLVTADGVRLHVTPNHPVLTSRGMVAAQHLNLGDEVITLRHSTIDPDNEHAVPTVEELYRSCSESPTALIRHRGRMNLHGDEVDQSVEIVRPDWGLTDHLERLKHGDNGILVRLRDAQIEFSSYSSRLHAPSGLLGEMVSEPATALTGRHVAFDGDAQRTISLPGEISTLVWRHLLETQSVGLAARAWRETESLQPPDDRVAISPESVSHRQDALAEVVAGTQLVLVDDYSIAESVVVDVARESECSQSTADGLPIDGEVPGDTSSRPSFSVQSVKLVEINRNVSGHWVYNLTSSSGLLWSPAALHSNCRCTMLDYYVGDTLPDGTLVTREGAEMAAADAGESSEE